ncbi:MAG: tRNA (N(6)-L-threonylcarbamoyladenosine(37)-C(2))-methylthiotransferase MtaB [Oscillospiraceae bacterium]|nr:tRNA (N(6)-L-threonylcarbamoyladenosine(37)-C(2))-methylthiotransferase MtaB [Oscillospiraceae bacterium]
MTVYFYTLGCKVNQYETRAMMAAVRAAGMQADTFSAGFSAAGDYALVINSCTVTAEADRKLRQLLRRCRRDNPGAVIALTGCMPQAYPETAERYTEADIVLGNTARGRLPAYIRQFQTLGRRVVDILPHGEAFESPGELRAFEGRTRAYIKIEDGCDRFCSYCIVPYARGRVRSRPLAEIRAEAETLAAAGYTEVVLVGINLTAYGSEINHSFTLADAVEQAAAAEGIRRIRLGSLEPDQMDGRLLDRLAAQPKLCPQFHLSLQSGCDATLRRMNRRYTAADYAGLADRLRRRFPGCALTTDVMVGFPGETREEFAESLDFVKKTGFSRAHIFPYSRRPGTPAAAAKDQVSAAEKAARAGEMAAAAETGRAAYEETFIGRNAEVLVEIVRPGGECEGFNAHYLPVRFYGETANMRGQTVRVRITGRSGDFLIGERL